MNPKSYNRDIKRIAALHDLSGFGRCSLTVIIPILSAMGIQVCPVPTAVLSTHTGGFDGPAMKDLTDFMGDCLNHYKRLGVSFDAVYSGFLSCEAQIDNCLDFFNAYNNALKIVDPVMGDYGEPYKTYTHRLCARMSELIKIADVITPNLTEAAILLNENYDPEPSLDKAKQWLERLCKHSKSAVITGIKTASGICNTGFDGNDFFQINCDYVPAEYPGTGDIFASVLTGRLLKGDKLSEAVNRASAFAQKAVKETYIHGDEPRNGVRLESVLGEL